MTFTYDGDGNRMAKTVGGVTTQFLVDTANPTGYAQVVDELASGTVSRTYTYGLELISETQPIDGTATTSYYGFDGHGSVRQLFDSGGSVTDTYTYDAFGNLIDQTGSTPNNYLFAGEQYDWDLGLYYNRARYLDVRTGRFWGMDTEEGDEENSFSLHKYLYANADPVDGLDPSGHDDIAGMMGAMSMSMTLDVMPSIQLAATLKAATPIPEYPGTREARQLVGAVYAESSTHYFPRKNPGEFPDEKIAIAQTFINEAYYASIYPHDDGGRGRNFGNGTIMDAININSRAVGSDGWNEVMNRDDLKNHDVLDRNLTDTFKRIHFMLSVIAVNEVCKGGLSVAIVDELNGRIPVGFNKAADTPPNPLRQEKIGTAGNHTFYGFKAGQEGKR